MTKHAPPLRQILDTLLTTWTEERFTTGTFARTRDGSHCDYDAPAACTWCAEGALSHAAEAYPDSVYCALMDRVESSLAALFGPERALSWVNDGQGYHAIRAILEHARDALD